MISAVRGHHTELRCIEVYLPSQLQTLVAVVISVIHFIVPLSQDYPAHHHSQVDTLGPEVKLLHLQTGDDSSVWNEVRLRHDSTCELSYRDVGEDQGCQELPRLLHLGFLRTPPHALSSYFITQVPQSLGHKKREVNMWKSGTNTKIFFTL